jgi:translation initiation factor 1
VCVINAYSVHDLILGAGVSKDIRLVYSTDPLLNRQCPKCKELLTECACEKEPEFSNSKFVAILRIEKSGRAGKTVTVIDQLPKIELFLKDMTSELKKKCGAGGTYIMDRKEGVIEIQGDKRESIRGHFSKIGIKFKG